MHRRAELGERAALVGIVGNIFLSAAKFVVGIVAGSTAVIADALHSFSDVIISALTWLGIRIAKKPPDREHQLGHYDVEPIVGLIVSIVLAVIGFEFARYSLSMLYSPQIPKTSAIYITIFAIFFKEAMTRYTLSIAQEALRSKLTQCIIEATFIPLYLCCSESPEQYLAILLSTPLQVLRCQF